MSGSIALIAGGGMLPLYWLEKAAVNKIDVLSLCISDYANQEKLRGQSQRYEKLSARKPGEAIRLIRENGISKAIWLGNVGRDEFLSSPVEPDSTFIRIMKSIDRKNLTTFFTALADEFEREGIVLLQQTHLMGDHIASEGILTSEIEVDDRILSDMNYALESAKKMSNIGAGQTVAVKSGSIIAVEAVEGTDNTIKRSGTLAKECIIAKACSPWQDMRFDIPAVGLNTIKSMISAGSSALVLEAGRVFLLEKDEMLRLASDNGIIIAGMRGPDV